MVVVVGDGSRATPEVVRHAPCLWVPRDKAGISRLMAGYLTYVATLWGRQFGAGCVPTQVTTQGLHHHVLEVPHVPCKRAAVPSDHGPLSASVRMKGAQPRVVQEADNQVRVREAGAQ